MTGTLPHIQTKYNLHRSDSGRLSSGTDTADAEKIGRSKPVQVQNWPRSLRDSVVAPPGYTIIGADWAAIEWCIAMYMAGMVAGDGYHWSMLDRFQAGQFDPHRFLASLAFERPEQEITSEQRRLSKPFTFGCLFRGNPVNIGAKSRINRAISTKVGQAHEQAFRLHSWGDDVMNRVVREHYVDTLGGWRRWFFEIPKKGVRGQWLSPDPGEVLATKVQGTAADLMKWVMAKALNESEVVGFYGQPREGAWIIPLTTLHDALYIMVQDERVEEGKDWLGRKMTQPIPFLGGRSWRCEVKTGKDWKKVA